MKYYIIICILLSIAGIHCSPVVVGGKAVQIQQYPYQISIQKSEKYICGGVIIGRDWAITAAQCVKGISESSLAIRAGSNNANSGGVVYKVSKTILHNQYDSKKHLNDIALLKVASSFNLGQSGINSIALPIQGENIPPQKDAFLTGYGLTSSSSIPTYVLQGVTLLTLDQSACKKIIPTLTNDMECAGYTTGGRDACTGDEGSPLVLNNKLIGITSWNFSCGKSAQPAVFTKVSSFRNWIKTNTGI